MSQLLSPTVAQVRQELARPEPLRRSVIIPVTPLTDSAEIVAAAETDDLEIGALVAANITGSSATVTLYVVPADGVPDDANAIAKGVAVAANDLLALVTRDAPLRLEPGESLQALASVASAINIFGNGFAVGGEG